MHIGYKDGGAGRHQRLQTQVVRGDGELALLPRGEMDVPGLGVVTHGRQLRVARVQVEVAGAALDAETRLWGRKYTNVINHTSFPLNIEIVVEQTVWTTGELLHTLK